MFAVFQKQMVRHAELFAVLRSVLVPDDKQLDLRDLTTLYFQPQRDENCAAVFVLVLLAKRADERDLFRLRIADKQAVRSLADHRPPRAVAHGELLSVLRELHGARERHELRIVLHDGVEKLIHGGLETRAVARAVLRERRSRKAGHGGEYGGY